MKPAQLLKSIDLAELDKQISYLYSLVPPTKEEQELTEGIAELLICLQESITE
jgi:hypothetical protein